MKTVKQLDSEMKAILIELETTEPNEDLKNYLTITLKTIVDILEDDVDPDYYEKLEKFILF